MEVPVSGKKGMAGWVGLRMLVNSVGGWVGGEGCGSPGDLVKSVCGNGKGCGEWGSSFEQEGGVAGE